MPDTSTSTGYATQGSEAVPYIAVTAEAILCADPILYEDFADCNVPGGRALWRQGGFYSPGVCFVGYTAGCTETRKGYREGFPIRSGETVVKCVPRGYSCNTETEDQRYATSQYGHQVLSAPAFEIRWRQEDIEIDSSRASTEDISTLTVTSFEILTTPSITSYWDQKTRETEATQPSSTGLIPKPEEVDHVTGHDKPISSRSIAGIAIGSTFAFLAITFSVIFFILRRRHSREDRLARFSEDFRNQGYPDVGLAPSGVELPMELDGSPVEPKDQTPSTESGQARRSFPHPFRHRAKHISVMGQPVELPA